MDETIQLAWLNHKTALSTFIPTFRGSNTFCDVTICCNGVYFPAHKLVLSTFSDYFKEILEIVPCRHPFIIVQDAQVEDVKDLLDFIYVGETSIANHRMGSFLRAAKNLKVKGLGYSALELDSPFSVYQQSPESNKADHEPVMGVAHDCKNIDLKGHFQTFDEPLTGESYHSSANSLIPEENLSNLVEKNPLETNDMDTQTVSHIKHFGTRHTSSYDTIPLPNSSSTIRPPNSYGIATHSNSYNTQSPIKNYGTVPSTNGNGHLAPSDSYDPVSPHNRYGTVPPYNSYDTVPLPNSYDGPVSPPNQHGLNGPVPPPSQHGFKKLKVVIERCPEAIKMGQEAKLERREKRQLMNTSQSARVEEQIPARDSNGNTDGNSDQDRYSEYSYNNDNLDDQMDNESCNREDNLEEGNLLLTNYCSAILDPPNNNEPSTSAERSGNFSEHFQDNVEMPVIKKEKEEYDLPSNSLEDLLAEESDPIEMNKAEEVTIPSILASERKINASGVINKKKTTRFKNGLKKRGFNLLKTFSCQFCPYKAQNSHNLIVHLRTHTGEKPYHCTLCSYRSTQKGSLNKHILTHTNKVFKCDICSFETTHKYKIVEHKNNHNESSIYQCDKCPFVTKFSRCLKNHIKSHVTKNAPIKKRRKGTLGLGKSDECQNVVGNPPEERKPFSCHMCMFTSSSRIELRYHEAGHKARKYVCPLCPYKVNVQLYFERHINFHMSASSIGKYRCDVCPYIAKSKCQLVYHLNVHSGDKPYECDQCTYKARSRGNLTLHTNRIHSPSKIVSISKNCTSVRGNKKISTTLGKVLDVKTSRVSSRAIKIENPAEEGDHGDQNENDGQDISENNGENTQPFTCDFPVASNNAVEFKKLVKRRFLCPICPYRNNRKLHYRRHLRMHNHVDAFKYQCDQCLYGTNTKQVMSYHMINIHHEKGSFKCDYCTFTAMGKHFLKRHISRKHLTEN